MKKIFYKKTILIFLIITLILLINVMNAEAQQAITIYGQGAIVSSSSFCDEFEDVKFTPDKAFDNDPGLPWIAAKDFNPNTDEWIKVTFSKPVNLIALRITPGFGHKSDMFYNYSRLKRFQVILDSLTGSRKFDYIRRFDSDPTKDMVLFYHGQQKVKSITVKVLDIYSGEKSKYALIGEIEPIITDKGNILSFSQAVEDVITFLRATRSAEDAFSFIPKERSITITKIIRNANPLDTGRLDRKSLHYNRETLRTEWSTWQAICQQMFTDYRCNTLETVNYIWKDPATKYTMFDMVGSETADVMNSYIFGLTHIKVREKVKKKDTKKTSSSKKETEVEITVLQPFITSLEMIQDIYAP